MSKWRLGFGTLVAITFVNLALSFAPQASRVSADAVCNSSARRCSGVSCSARCTAMCQCTGNSGNFHCYCQCSDGSVSQNFCDPE